MTVIPTHSKWTPWLRMRAMLIRRVVQSFLLLILMCSVLGCGRDNVATNAIETITPNTAVDAASPRLWEDKEMGDMVTSVLKTDDDGVLSARVIRWENGRITGYVNLWDESSDEPTRHELSQPADPDEPGSQAESGWLVVVERVIDEEKNLGANGSVRRRIEMWWELRGGGSFVRQGPLTGMIRRWADSKGKVSPEHSYTETSIKWWRNRNANEASNDTAWMELAVE